MTSQARASHNVLKHARPTTALIWGQSTSRTASMRTGASADTHHLVAAHILFPTQQPEARSHYRTEAHVVRNCAHPRTTSATGPTKQHTRTLIGPHPESTKEPWHTHHTHTHTHTARQVCNNTKGMDRKQAAARGSIVQQCAHRRMSRAALLTKKRNYPLYKNSKIAGQKPTWCASAQPNTQPAHLPVPYTT